MGHYIKYEVYLPTTFKDSDGTEKSVDPEDIRKFCNYIINNFGGVTESNPIAPPMYKGWWSSNKNISIDFLAYIFALIRLEKADEAYEFFEKWKNELETKLNQEFILISFHPIQILGEL